METIRLVLCTFPDAAAARQIGTTLVEKQLAACVNLIPGVESIYRWQGKLECAAEVLAIFKTSAAVFPEFEEALSELHPYDVPEIIAIEPAAVSRLYLEWVLAARRGAVSDPLVIHPELAGKILYDPTEMANENDWPEDSR
ncbi:MAG: divalent-cation tolerance protein CutA [Luteolibacter sp.]|jgi:periplasmic divalent cation tolerance protein|nr:divalent-cation tolerance protein CutA [Luteolibacter sp.]